MIWGSRLEQVLNSGVFAVLAQLTPPQHVQGPALWQEGLTLADRVDCVGFTDNQGAVVRLSSLASAAFWAFHGIDAVIALSCRDRNRIALQSDLLGAYALGIRTVLCVTGEHPKLGNEPGAKTVYDLDSIQLISLVHQLREKRTFLSGEACSAPPGFYIGGVINPLAGPLALRLLRLEKKIRAGADFILTQVVYDLEQFTAFMERVREHHMEQRVKILASVRPIKNPDEVHVLQAKRRGDIPDAMVERLSRASFPEREGFQIALEQIAALRQTEGLAGINIIADTMGEISSLVEQSGLYPRPGA